MVEKVELRDKDGRLVCKYDPQTREVEVKRNGRHLKAVIPKLDKT